MGAVLSRYQTVLWLSPGIYQYKSYFAWESGHTLQVWPQSDRTLSGDSTSKTLRIHSLACIDLLKTGNNLCPTNWIGLLLLPLAVVAGQGTQTVPNQRRATVAVTGPTALFSVFHTRSGEKVTKGQLEYGVEV